MTTASTDTRAPQERRQPAAVHRPQASPAARIALGAVAALTVGVVLLCSTPVIRFPSWREVVVTTGGAVSLACAWQLRTEVLAELRLRRPALATLSLVAVAASCAWSLGALLTAGAPRDLGVAAVVGVVVLACHGISREAATGQTAVPAWLTPGALVLAIVTVGVWLAFDARPSRALATGVAVAVAACPGALALALPAVYRFGTRRGDVLGIVVQGARVLERSRRIDTIVLDGLGTVTSGKRVATVEAFIADHERNLRWFAGALEHASDHPVGKAIAKLSARGRLSGIQTHPGLGISGSVDRHPVRVGRPDWLGIDVTERVGTTVGVEVDARPLGTITVVDAVRPTAKDAADALRRLGVDPVLVTTANPLTAKDIAEQVGIDRVIAEATPDSAANLVRELRIEGTVVASLGNAPIGDADFVMAASASPKADVLLSEGDVADGVTALTLTRAMDSHVRGNTQFAYAYTAIAVPLAAAGILPPLGAALAVATGSLVVLASAMRFRRFAA